MQNLVAVLDGWRQKQIVVVGDFMLDRHIYGNAERLSPDAPVPILAVERKEHAPGGAANVCLDLRALRCEVACIGVVGRDAYAQTLKAALREAGCQVGGIIAANDRPTTVKHNFVGLAQHRHPQKMFRVDEENNAPINHDTETKLLEKTRRAMRNADMLCIEDYNKGVVSESFCQALIKLGKKMNVPVFVDPAAIDNFDKYRGADCITPNRTEASIVTGIDATDAKETTLHRMGRKLQKTLDITSVVLTLDRQGLLLMQRKASPLWMATQAREVYDVTGAGDMVLAVLAAARANGIGWAQSLELANIAAGLEVERFGVVPITLDELLLAVLQRNSTELGKLRTLDQLTVELAAYRSQNKTIAFTNGCFDILHAGHIQYLREARKFADLLVVAINTDESIRRIKGKDRPVNTQDDRVMVLSELQSVDYIVLFDQDTPIKLIGELKPDFLIKGADYKSKHDVVGWDIVERYGGKVKRIGLVKGRSTTNIIRKINAHSPNSCGSTTR